MWRATSTARSQSLLQLTRSQSFAPDVWLGPEMAALKYGVADEDVLVSLALRGWHQLEKTFGKCLVQFALDIRFNVV